MNESAMEGGARSVPDNRGVGQRDGRQCVEGTAAERVEGSCLVETEEARKESERPSLPHVLDVVLGRGRP